jgi:hypothetical protein
VPQKDFHSFTPQNKTSKQNIATIMENEFDENSVVKKLIQLPFNKSMLLSIPFMILAAWLLEILQTKRKQNIKISGQTKPFKNI